MKVPQFQVSEYVCELLYDNSKHAIFAHIICAISFLYLYQDIISQDFFLFWLGVFTLMIGLKIAITWQYFRRPSDDENTNFWYRLFLIGSLTSSLVWATAIIMLFPENDPAYQLLLIVITIGFAGGSALTQSADKYAVLLFSQPILLATVIRLYWVDDTVYQATAGLLLFLDLPIIVAAWNSSEASFRLHQSAMVERKMNAAKTDFLANMSHEIRTPMNAVVGIGYLLEKTELSDQQQGYISKLQRASSSLLGIINNILDFSRIEAGQLELEKTPFDLHGVLQTVEAHVETQAKKKALNFHIDIDKNIKTHLIGDPLRLAQVLTNLSANGVKFTEKGGVRLLVEQEANEKNSVQLKFSVIDTGQGIEEQDKSKLFESFSQLNTSDTRMHGGTGLGLAISQRLLRMMGSEIQVESALGKGTNFSFLIWLGLAEHNGVSDDYHIDRSPSAKILEQLPDLIAKEVLVVDDDELNQKIAKEMLHIFGLSVRIASSAKEAFLLLSEGLPDLIFMDVQMPEMTGYEELDILRANPAWQDIPVIALTANARVVERRKALSYGMDDFLTKPIDPQQLKQTLLDWIPHENSNIMPVESVNLSSIVKEKSTSKVEIEDKLHAVIDMLGAASSKKFFKKVHKVIEKEEPRLKRLLQEHCWDEAATLAHRLKGSLNLYGSSLLENVLTQIDDKAIASDDTADICEILQKEFDYIQRSIERYI